MHKLKRQTTTLYPLRDQLETEAFHFMLKGRLTGQLPQNEVNKMKFMANTHQSPGILALLPKTGPPMHTKPVLQCRRITRNVTHTL